MIQMPSPAAKVFAIPELLEAILLKLDDPAVRGDDWTVSIADLFTCLRVNKTFNSTINGSMSLKRVMLLEFREPLVDETQQEDAKQDGEDYEEDEDDEDEESPPLYGLNFLFRCSSDRARDSKTRSKVLCLHPAMPEYLTGPNATISFWFEGTGLTGAVGSDHPRWLTAYPNIDILRSTNPSLVAHASSASKHFENISHKGYLSREASWRRMKLNYKPGLVKRVCVALLDAGRPFYISHEYGTITSFDDSVETLGDLFDIVVRLKDRDTSKHLEMKQKYNEVGKVMRKALNEWRHGRRGGRWAAKLEELTAEHDESCTESVERASCAYCYVKRYQRNIEEGEVLTEAEFGAYV